MTRKASAETQLRDAKRRLIEYQSVAQDRARQIVSLRRDIAERDQRISDLKNTIGALNRIMSKRSRASDEESEPERQD